MNKDIKDIINSVGATAEMLRLFYDNLIKQGFTNQEALQLTSNYMKAVFGK